ncbi:ABC transporter permease subunit [Paenibacillus lycopersici]|uniref:ABC transporter permease subunit n=1 Tax=Paenibacillus lycopersici TaxID=2704462 RepID=A0A6C0FVU7_9BACL|nr:ABC transporter permease subunit [Paenibacillus lycopersici]QHT59563.1 ABC transporter permease subunit [Paenibacillus lycopersici]
MMWIVFAGKELFRKKIVLVTFVLTLLYVGLFNFGLYKLMHQSRLIGLPFENVMEGVTLLSLGLLFGGMIVAFFVFFATMGTISGEVESGLMLAVLARPIPRWKVYLGKYFGTAFWILIYCTVLFLAMLLPVREMADVPLGAGSMFKAWLGFAWGPLLLLAVSMLGSVFFPMLGNGVACAILYGLGLFSGFAETLFSATGGSSSIGGLLFSVSLLMPANSMFSRVTYEIIGGLDLPLLPDMMSRLGPFSPTNVPSPAFLGYSVIYWAALLALGCWAFKRKDIA